MLSIMATSAVRAATRCVASPTSAIATQNCVAAVMVAFTGALLVFVVLLQFAAQRALE